MKRTRFFRSFGCALKGIAVTIRDERNIKVQLAVAALALTLGAVVLRDPFEWVVVILCCGCVIGAELINTAIEHVVDLVSPEWNELAGKAKDAAAGAVLVIALAAGTIGVIVYVHAFLQWMEQC